MSDPQTDSYLTTKQLEITATFYARVMHAQRLASINGVNAAIDWYRNAMRLPSLTEEHDAPAET